MNGWILPIVLYIVGFTLFGLLGGLASAADAFRQWGEATSRARRAAGSSSSA
jgi:hypothetical protein